MSFYCPFFYYLHFRHDKRFAVIARKVGVSCIIAGEGFGCWVELDGSADSIGDVAKMAERRALEAFFDIDAEVLVLAAPDGGDKALVFVGTTFVFRPFFPFLAEVGFVAEVFHLHIAFATEECDTDFVACG